MTVDSDVQREGILCPHCKQIGTAAERGTYNFVSDALGEPLQTALIDCDNCRGAILVERYYDWSTGGFSRSRVIYPRDAEPSVTVPRPVREAYAEAIRCRDAQAYTATVIMCRRSLEAIAEDKKAVGRTLYAKLQALKEAGEIPPEIFEWFTLLREMGNDAAHSVQVTHTEQDASDAADFVLAITEYLYTYKLRFSEFKERVAAAKIT